MPNTRWARISIARDVSHPTLSPFTKQFRSLRVNRYEYFTVSRMKAHERKECRGMEKDLSPTDLRERTSASVDLKAQLFDQRRKCGTGRKDITTDSGNKKIHTTRTRFVKFDSKGAICAQCTIARKWSKSRLKSLSQLKRRNSC
ncbi:Uncharacterized protein PFLU_2499 [Pseudomonas [fluorescens] SBW25]|uniref:Uncharacterized protein n=1 Tax=Pseudomonas fluorescens (strain SBW25) TaxID=216595 RepID=C3K8R6_PSEFS|nr:Uncharacterized protein PFLU_2499 [Pseudomonas fluorescens SBW25]